MRTLKSIFFNRLAAQAQEADSRGLVSLASNLTSQLEKNAAQVREDDEEYTYDTTDRDQDLDTLLWDAFVRLGDFYDVQVQGEEVQSLVEYFREQMVEEFCQKMGIDSSAGAHESNLPGEPRKKVVLDLDEEGELDV